MTEKKIASMGIPREFLYGGLSATGTETPETLPEMKTEATETLPEETPAKEEEKEEKEKEKKRVDKIYVFLTDIPEQNKEGIVSVAFPGAGVVPLIAMDDKQLERFSKTAQIMANESGRDIWIEAFTASGEVARFEQKLVQPARMSIGARDWKIGS